MEDTLRASQLHSAAYVREVFDGLLPTQDALSTFCARHFPELLEQLDLIIQRTGRIELLLREVAEDRLLSALLAEAELQESDAHYGERGVAMGPLQDTIAGLRALLFERDPIERAFARQVAPGWFVLDVPNEMTAGIATPVSVSAIGSQLRKELLLETIQHGGSQAEAALLAKVLCVELTAEPGSCTIQPPPQIEQAVLRDEVTVWEWLVTPHPDAHRLRLRVALVNVLDVGGRSIRKALPRRTVEILVFPPPQGADESGSPPIVSRAQTRRLLVWAFPLDSELSAFCLDCFKEVFDRFTEGMDRIQKVNLLLAWEEPESVMEALQSYAQQQPWLKARLDRDASINRRTQASFKRSPSSPSSQSSSISSTQALGSGTAGLPSSSIKQVEEGATAAKTYSLSILHISDLHARGARETDRWRRERVLGEEWKRNLDALLGEGPIDLVCFTGDLADWGKAGEYEDAAEFLGATLRHLGVPVERFFIVPGNHDIDREYSADAKQAWKGLRANRWKVDPLLLSRWLLGGSAPPDTEASWREAVLSRQEPYRRWLHAFNREALLPDKSPHGRLGYRATLQLPSLPFAVHILGLDSSWLCGNDADASQLMLTEDQVGRLCSDAEGKSLGGFRLALVHHPLSDLADGAACGRLLAERVDMLLRGHLHEPEPGLWADPDRFLHQIAAGCLYEGHHADRWPNGCALLRITCSSTGRPLRYELRLRGWSPRGHWFDDGSLYRKAPDGRLRLDFARP